jgi:AraC-like DNA-binding protein
MKLMHLNLSALLEHSIHAEQIEHPRLQCPFHTQPQYHCHPEVELLYVVQGRGKRIINGFEETFESGDMVFLGSNVPHVWVVNSKTEDENKGNRAILMYFDVSRFDTMFRTVDELNALCELLNVGLKGIQIIGATKEILAQKLDTLITAKGFERIILVLQIMHILSISTDKRYIVKDPQPLPASPMPDRLIGVIHFIKENLHRNINLTEVAQIAGMSKNAFCRFFHKRMKKTFSFFLQEQRIALACVLLVQSNKSISEISQSCGYGSTSHFCKTFKAELHLSPQQYRSSLNSALA